MGSGEMQKAAEPIKGRVRFGLGDSASRENSVLIQEHDPGCIHVHLGFLQFNHNYNISLDIPKAFFLGYNFGAISKAAERGDPNVNCKITSFQENIECLHMTVEFHARKEKLLKEEIDFKFDDKMVKLVFIARVLGEGKGTPLLKNEVTCIGAEMDDEMSESSDWAGFD